MLSSLSTLPLRPPPHFSTSRPNPTSINFRHHHRVVAVYAATAETTCTRSSSKMSSSSLYQLLGISAAASVQDIKSAYRTLARTLHPDVAANGRKGSSVDDFLKIHAAYSTLSDPEKRADYDRRLLRKQRPLVTSEVVYERYGGGYTSRNWESNQCW